MVIDMNEAQVRTLEQVRQVLKGTQSLEFRRAEDDEGRYTAADVALLAEVDRAMDTLSGPATACVLRRQRDVVGDMRFARLAELSVGHLYNLRNSAI